MTDNRNDSLPDKELERLLARAVVNDPVPSMALMQRIVADADSALDRLQKPVHRRRELGILAALGGWPALTGLVTATAAGIWIGFAQPGPVGGFADGVIPADSGYDIGDLMPEYESVLVEG